MRRRGGYKKNNLFTNEWDEIIDFAVNNSIDIPTGAEYDRLENICAQLVNNEQWNELDTFSIFETSAPPAFRLIDWIRKHIQTEVNVPVYTDTGVEQNSSSNAYILTGYTPSIHAVKFQVENLTVGIKMMTAWPTNNSGIVGGRTGNNDSQIAIFNGIARTLDSTGSSIDSQAGLFEFKKPGVPDIDTREVFLNGVKIVGVSPSGSSSMCTVEQTILRTNGLYTAKAGTKIGAVYYGSKNIDPVIMNNILNP